MNPKTDREEASPMDWPMPAPEGFNLELAVRNGQVEFWFQPKIDLQKRRLVGLEAFARLCDGEGNVIQGAELIAGASTRALTVLTEKALVSALKTSANLLEIGIDVRIAVNVNVAALTQLPLQEIVDAHRRRQPGQPANIVFDVTEAEVIGNFDKMLAISRSLGMAGLSIAVDDFGASLLALARGEEAYEQIDRTFEAIRQLGDIRFSEMKIDRALVRNCSESEDRQKVCSYIVRTTQDFGSTAVAVGIETMQDMLTLKKLGCDIGQGFLFGRPMTEDELLVLLWERAVRIGAKRPAA